MSRIKTFCKYILLLVGFYILSNILIFFGINTSYNNLSIKDSIPEQVHITDASATLVNGRVKGYLSIFLINIFNLISIMILIV